MKCPFCSSENTRVIDSRPADDNNSIRRRRLCDDCGKRFTTYEKVETIPLIVIKKDNAREQYDRSKIEAGVLRACHKRPISVNQINQLVDEVETEIFNREEKEIPSTLIGEIVMDKIKNLDSVAYVRFASVYREFKDVNTFMSELMYLCVSGICQVNLHNRELAKSTHLCFFILQNLRCPLRAVPHFIDNVLIKFRFMADQKDTAAVFLKRTF